MGKNLDSNGYLVPGPRKDLEPLFQVIGPGGNPVEIESIYVNCSGLLVQIRYEEEWDKI